MQKYTSFVDPVASLFTRALTESPTQPLKRFLGLSSALLVASALSAGTVAETIHPAKLTAEDQTGKIFEHPDTTVQKYPEGYILEFTSMMASDKRFGSGMYESGPAVEIYNEGEPYGVDEFMYFLEGGITLTSSDGTVIELEAGEAVTIPKEWTGRWDTQGYRKIWVFYSEEPYLPE